MREGGAGGICSVMGKSPPVRALFSWPRGRRFPSCSDHAFTFSQLDARLVAVGELDAGGLEGGADEDRILAEKMAAAEGSSQPWTSGTRRADLQGIEAAKLPRRSGTNNFTTRGATPASGLRPCARAR